MSSFIYMQGKENSRRFRHSPLPVKNYFRFNTILQRQRSKVLHKVKNTKKETLAYSLKKILLNVLQGRRKKQPIKKTTLQNPTKYNLVSILDPRFPACIFASQISKRGTKAFSSRLPQELQETHPSGLGCTAAKLSLCSATPQLHCRVKRWCRRSTRHLVRVKSCPTKPQTT